MSPYSLVFGMGTGSSAMYGGDLTCCIQSVRFWNWHQAQGMRTTELGDSCKCSMTSVRCQHVGPIYCCSHLSHMSTDTPTCHYWGEARDRKLRGRKPKSAERWRDVEHNKRLTEYFGECRVQSATWSLHIINSARAVITVCKLGASPLAIQEAINEPPASHSLTFRQL